MSKRNARVAGITFLLYYATALGDMFLFGWASSGAGTAARLANIAHSAPLVRLTVVFTLLTVVYALILAVTLYALTRDVDPEVALIAATCRVVEGVINAVPTAARLGLLSIATATAAANSPDATSLETQAALLLKVSGWSTTVGATIFAIGSTLFAYLFLRGGSIPAVIAWLGVIGSLLIIPIFLVSSMWPISGTVVWLTSTPLIAFELALAFWLLIKGVSTPVIGAQQKGGQLEV